MLHSALNRTGALELGGHDGKLPTHFFAHLLLEETYDNLLLLLVRIIFGLTHPI